MRRVVSISGALAALILTDALPALSPLPASAAGPRPPAVATGKATHARGTAAELTGSVTPAGSPTTYFFQFGPTIAYGFRTATGNAGSVTNPIKVALRAAPFAVGYHFRLVATNAFGTSFGKDKVFAPKKTKLKFEVIRKTTVTYGASVVIGGRIKGLGAGSHRLALEASPYPYKEAFEEVGRPTITSASGRFAFRVRSLRRSTQFRVITLDRVPRFSPIVTVHVAVKVTLRVKKSSSSPGFVRLFGIVTPASVGARVQFQFLKQVRPGKTEKTEERTVKYTTTGNTTVRRATRKFSFFSAAVLIRRTGRYRAVVVLRKGPLVSGSSRSFVLHAAPGGRAKH